MTVSVNTYIVPQNKVLNYGAYSIDKQRETHNNCELLSNHVSLIF